MVVALKACIAHILQLVCRHCHDKMLGQPDRLHFSRNAKRVGWIGVGQDTAPPPATPAVRLRLQPAAHDRVVPYAGYIREAFRQRPKHLGRQTYRTPTIEKMGFASAWRFHKLEITPWKG